MLQTGRRSPACAGIATKGMLSSQGKLHTADCILSKIPSGLRISAHLWGFGCLASVEAFFPVCVSSSTSYPPGLCCCQDAMSSYSLTVGKCRISGAFRQPNTQTESRALPSSTVLMSAETLQGSQFKLEQIKLRSVFCLCLGSGILTLITLICWVPVFNFKLIFAKNKLNCKTDICRCFFFTLKYPNKTL